MKKKTLTILLFLFGTTVFAQDPMTQGWNYQNQINPASYGLLYKHEANAAHNFGAGKLGSRSISLLSYSAYLEKSKIGFGIAFTDHYYSHDAWFNSRENTIKAGLNKQFGLKNGMVFSTGLNVGTTIKTQFELDPNDPHIIIPRNQPFFTCDIGVALKWKKLMAMMSVNHFADNGGTSSSREYVNLNGLVSYSFGNKDGIEICPIVSYRYQNNYEYFQTMVLAKYQSKYWVGTGLVNFADQWVGTAGATFYNKFRVGYGFTYSFSDLSYYSIARHEINLAFVLDK